MKRTLLTNGLANTSQTNARTEQEPPLSPAEVARYELAWQFYRKYEARYWIPFATYIPGVLLFGWLLSFLMNSNLAHCIVAFSWLVLWSVSGRKYSSFCCPRCGKYFFVRQNYSNLFSSKCLNCGLPKYAYDRTVMRDEF
jgi:predicted RNA-binding Zn-ribbon protein involved in translation (DUF1610 family)